jgi:hypothetical protein
MPVAVQIGDEEPLRTAARRIIHPRRQIPAAGSQQDADVVCGLVGRDHVQHAVAVDVCQANTTRSGPDGVIDFGRERPVRVLQQYADRVRVVIGRHNVRPTVAVDIPDCDGDRIAARGQMCGRLKGAVPVPP